MIARIKRTGAYVDVYKEGSVISKNGTEGCYYRFGDAAKNVIYGSELVFEKDNEGKALLYAVEKTAERTKREVVEKAVKWLDTYFESVINSDLEPVASEQNSAIDKVRMARRMFANKMLYDFRKTMQDE